MSATGIRKYPADGYEIVRNAMVERLREHYSIRDERLLETMLRLPRHLFLPNALWPQAYKDNAVPIASGQTMSQPYIVAKMSQLLGLTGGEKVLEIGSGSGYQTAIIASLAGRVFAVERLPELAREAKARLNSLGIHNVTIRVGDGTLGWGTYQPFDAILVAAGGPVIPEPLVQQLGVGGRMVLPIGKDLKEQHLIRITKTETSLVKEDFGPCSFVPLIGEHGWT